MIPSFCSRHFDFAQRGSPPLQCRGKKLARLASFKIRVPLWELSQSLIRFRILKKGNYRDLDLQQFCQCFQNYVHHAICSIPELKYSTSAMSAPTAPWSSTALHRSSSQSSRSTSTTFRDGCTYDEIKNVWSLNALWQYKYMGACGYTKAASSSDLSPSRCNVDLVWSFQGRFPLVISSLHHCELCPIDVREYQHKTRLYTPVTSHMSQNTPDNFVLI